MTREFSRNIKSKGIIISETTSWGWHGIKQPSGKHNTINILLTRGARVLGEYSVEVAVQTVNLLLSGSGGSTPSSPIISSEYEIWRMAEYVKKSDVIKIMENNSHMIEVFGVKKKIIDGFAMGCDFEDLETVSIEEDDKED